MLGGLLIRVFLAPLSTAISMILLGMKCCLGKMSLRVTFTQSDIRTKYSVQVIKESRVRNIGLILQHILELADCVSCTQRHAFGQLL